MEMAGARSEPLLDSSASSLRQHAAAGTANKATLSHLPSFEQPEDNHVVEAVIFQGGGTKGVVYAGCVKRLEEAGILDHVKYFAGTSAGSQTATLAAVGYTGDELKDIMSTAPWGDLLDGTGGPCGMCRGVTRLFRRKGIFRGDFLEQYLEGLISRKFGNRSGVTFRMLYDEMGKTLRLGVCNIGKQKFEFLDYETAPNMPLSVACRASSSIPFIFVPKVYEDHHYVDGGLQGNFPSSAFPASMNGIAFQLLRASAFAQAEEEQRRDAGPSQPPSTFMGFAEVVVEMLFHHARLQSGEAVQSEQEMNRRAFRDGGMKVIRINTGRHGGLETDLQQAQINEMIRAGADAVERYLEQRRSVMGT